MGLFQLSMTKSLVNLPYFQLYLMEAGKQPFEGAASATTGEIVATRSFWPSGGQTLVGGISVDEIKDMTKGDTSFVPTYSVSATGGLNDWSPYVAYTAISNVTAGDATGMGTGAEATNEYNSNVISEDAGELYCISAFAFDTFIVRQVTIRYPTTGEVWSEIGGLYAGSLFILVLFFASTGYVNDKGAEVQVFKWLPSATREEWLKGFSKKLTAEQIMANRVKELEEKVEQLLADREPVAAQPQPKAAKQD
jgi:hypothetical protein